MKPIIIIGNGIAGVTAAREIRKLDSDVPILIISGETDHHFSRTALMYIFMGHMKYEHTKPYEDYFWEKNRIDLLRGWVKDIDHQNNQIVMDNGDKLEYQELNNVEESAKTAKHAVIVGGGLIGIEMAEMLMARGISVSFLVRENIFWGGVLPEQEAKMIEAHIRDHHCDLRMGDEMVSCHKDLEMDRGIMIDHYFQTNIPNIWSIGDCAQFRDPLPGRRPLEQVWYTGKMHGAHLAQNLRGERKAYEPGIWWNSAKFFDIEYQTYGIVMPKPMEGEASFYWQAPETNHAVHIHFDVDTLIVKGVNVFGIRHRHQVWENWLATKATMKEVMTDLSAANFDPEFFKQYEGKVILLSLQIQSWIKFNV